MRKIRVPQADGEVVFTDAGEATVHVVSDHLITPRSRADSDKLLQLVDGARLATPKEEAPASTNSAGGNTAGDDGSKG